MKIQEYKKIVEVLEFSNKILEDKLKILKLENKALKKQFVIKDVSHRRELLKGYNEYLADYIDTHFIDDDLIENYLDTL